MIGIYKITSPTGKIYIGKSIDIIKRWGEYMRQTKSIQAQIKISNSLKKYGPEKHIFEVLVVCPKNELADLEIFFIKKYNSVKKGLNCRCDGSQPEMIKTTRNKIRATKLNRKRPDLSARNKIIRPALGRTGFKHPLSKLVLNLETGIYYESASEAACSLNIKKSTLTKRLSGINPNKTSFRYV